MQFNRDASGTLTSLPKPCVDTGMGLERVACVLQGVISNYDTDLFQPLMGKAARLLEHDMSDAAEEVSRRIIADHSRASTFLISDGVMPANEGRGYVLRKIINRALLNAGPPETVSDQVLPAMAETVAQQMRAAYPELDENMKHVGTVLTSETSRYRRTMTTSLAKLREEVAQLVKALPPQSTEARSEERRVGREGHSRERAYRADGGGE